MIKTFTPLNSILLHYYGELNASESEVFEHVLISDADLQSAYVECKEMIRNLSFEEYLPSQDILDNILEYAQTK
jgi:hypothetical protein